MKKKDILRIKSGFHDKFIKVIPQSLGEYNWPGLITDGNNNDTNM